MDNDKRIAPHETFELHELITFKNICATKAATMSEKVKDEELKSLLSHDLSLSQGHIKELQNLITKSEYNEQIPRLDETYILQTPFNLSQ